MTRVAINGFGRIGRMVFRTGHGDDDIDFVAVNDLTDTETLAHLLKYDSVHGRFPGKIEHTPSSLIVNGKEIKVLAERDPETLPWAELKIDVVVESTGIFRKKDQMQKHINAGAKKVLLSAPAKDGDVKTVVMGVNDHTYKGETLVSNASCTTNCLAPMVKVLHESFGVEKGMMTTVHGYTADQSLVDGPHKDLRRARAAALNIVPTTTGAAIAVTKVLPELEGKLDGMALRVPVPDGSVTDFTAELKREVSIEQVNKAFEKASKELLGILRYETEKLVSTDIIGDSHSCIFDSDSTNVVRPNLVKVIGWYDNEWGYSSRMIDLIKLMSRK